MKTRILIVRLSGLFLVANCSLSLTQSLRARSLAGASGFPNQPFLENTIYYAVGGLVIGVLLSVFAARTSGLLTFDFKEEEIA